MGTRDQFNDSLRRIVGNGFPREVLCAVPIPAKTALLGLFPPVFAGKRRVAQLVHRDDTDGRPIRRWPGTKKTRKEQKKRL